MPKTRWLVNGKVVRKRSRIDKSVIGIAWSAICPISALDVHSVRSVLCADSPVFLPYYRFSYQLSGLVAVVL
jgi:hypothetical protein